MLVLTAVIVEDVIRYANYSVLAVTVMLQAIEGSVHDGVDDDECRSINNTVGKILLLKARYLYT